jgi:hypothetical protein
LAYALQGQAVTNVLKKELGNWIERISFDICKYEVRNTKMSEKKTIKVIKKGEKKRPVAAGTKANPAREAAREMVQTVTNWVTEFQQKRRTETTNALRIRAETPRGSEA